MARIFSIDKQSRCVKTAKKTTTTHDHSTCFLAANNESYEWLLDQIDTRASKVDIEAKLKKIQLAAKFATEFHTGRFVDGRLENALLEIAEKVPDEPTVKIAPTDIRRRVLHVASTVGETGGHTRMLYNWIELDKASCHSLALLNQASYPVPAWLTNAVKESGGVLDLYHSEKEIVRQAINLRHLAIARADVVILHTDPFDIIPVIAFGIDKCPQVALVNHADHCFWVGSSVADLVISLRTVGAENAKLRRNARNNAILPVPLADANHELTREQARIKLVIPHDRVMLLSIARPEKYRPYASFDFVATINKILFYRPNAHMYVVGESATGILPYLRSSIHDRLHFMGSLEDPSYFRAAADVYLESFPFGSQTALLEAGLSGLPVVPSYAPMSPLLVANDDSLTSILENPINEKQFIERVLKLIDQPQIRHRLGLLTRRQLLDNHVGSGWLKELNSVYRKIEQCRHTPHAISKSICNPSEEDIGLSNWHAVVNGRESTSIPETVERIHELRHSAFVAKEAGNYGRARMEALLAIKHDLTDWDSWRLQIVTLLGKSGKLSRMWISRARQNISVMIKDLL